MKFRSVRFSLFLTLSLFFFNGIKAQVTEQDSLALVDLYNSTDGSNWTNNSNWLTGPVLTWYGISVIHGPQFLYIIDLEKNNLTGIIPSSIGKLPARVLNLSHNKLSGNIPAAIGSLVALKILDLSFNQLTGSIPPEIGNLGYLEPNDSLQINFSHNQLTGTIPPELSRHPEQPAKRITGLDFSFNQLEGGLTLLVRLRHLNYLHLDNNKFRGTVPASFQKFTPGIDLWLQNNHFTFSGMEMIAGTFANAVYAPQANIPVHQNGGSLSVSVVGTLSNNLYKWYKVGQTQPVSIPGDSVFYPSESGDYYAKIVNSICTQLTLHTDTITYNAILPVNITDLKAQQHGSVIKVEWTSLTEINVNNYEIQQSSNSRDFVTVGTLPAKSNGAQQIAYSFSDAKPVKGDNFYRVKAVDNDGKLTYSNTVLVKMLSDGRNVTLAYPNPAKSILNVQIEGSASFSLINQNGRTIFTKAITNSAAIDVSGFAAGLYYLKNNSTGEVQKIVVEK